MVELQSPGDAFHFDRGALHRDVFLKAGDNLKKMVAARSHATRVHCQRRPYIRAAGGEGKGRRHHAGNRVPGSVEHDAAANYIAGGAEMTPPKRVANHRDTRARFVVLLLEIAAECGA